MSRNEDLTAVKSINPDSIVENGGLCLQNSYVAQIAAHRLTQLLNVEDDNTKIDGGFTRMLYVRVHHNGREELHAVSLFVPPPKSSEQPFIIDPVNNIGPTHFGAWVNAETEEEHGYVLDNIITYGSAAKIFVL